MNPTRRTAMLFSAVLSLSGCHLDWVREHPLGCRPDERALVRDTLYFGRSIPGGGNVSDEDWKRFEAEVIAPAFPQGYSVLDAHGRWRGNDGNTIGEDSTIITLVHPDDTTTAAAVRAIASNYRERFHQESVLRERSAVCASF
jgi:hypothetical protein